MTVTALLTRPGKQTVHADSLAPGDLLLVTGGSVFSKLARLIEGTAFDHCLMVAPPDPGHPKFGRDSDDDRTHEPWTFDVGFFGGRHLPLSAYDDTMAAILVRRHRYNGSFDQSMVRARTAVDETKGYAWDRLLYLCLIGATRWSPALCELAPDESSAFVRALYEVLGQMRRSQLHPLGNGGKRRICTDIVTEAFDVVTEVTDVSVKGPPGQYLGIVAPNRMHEGLLWWAAGVSTFEDFLTTQPPPRRTAILDEDLATAPGSEEALRLVHEAATATGVSYPGFVPADDDTLRAVVIDGVNRSLNDLLGQTNMGLVGGVTDPRRAAWFLLDIIMRKRVVLSPHDLSLSKSFFDLGWLPTTDIDWRK
jgi:hypothetical protein